MNERPAGFLTVSRKGGKTTVEFSLSGAVFKGEKAWVAHCRELDLSSQGPTRNEALTNIKEAIELFFESCIERNTLEKTLTQLGWVCIEKGRKVACSPGMLSMAPPPAFVIDAIERQGNTWTAGVSLAG